MINLYDYDKLGRLKNVQEKEIASTGEDLVKDTSYSYDSSHNISTKTNNLLGNPEDNYEKYTYSDNGTNLSYYGEHIDGVLNQATQRVYTKDLNGNITKDQKIGKFFEYDVEDRLVHVEGQGITGTLKYNYDSEGLLTQIRRSPTDITRFVWEDGKIVLEFNQNNEWQKKHRWGTDGLISTDTRNLSNNSIDREYFINDTHGNVVQKLNENRGIIKTYMYDEFGVEQDIDPNDTNPFRYCGEYYDKNTDMLYLRDRFYDADIGRFIQRDSFEGKENEALTLNRYT